MRKRRLVHDAGEACAICAEGEEPIVVSPDVQLDGLLVPVLAPVLSAPWSRALEEPAEVTAVGLLAEMFGIGEDELL